MSTSPPNNSFKTSIKTSTCKQKWHLLTLPIILAGTDDKTITHALLPLFFISMPSSHMNPTFCMFLEATSCRKFYDQIRLIICTLTSITSHVTLLLSFDVPPSVFFSFFWDWFMFMFMFMFLSWCLFCVYYAYTVLFRFSLQSALYVFPNVGDSWKEKEMKG